MSELSKRLLELHYDLLSPEEEEQLKVRIERELDVAKLYKDVKQTAQLFSQAAKVEPGTPFAFSVPNKKEEKEIKKIKEEKEKKEEVDEEKQTVSPPPERPESITSSIIIRPTASQRDSDIPAKTRRIISSAIATSTHFHPPEVRSNENTDSEPNGNGTASHAPHRSLWQPFENRFSQKYRFSNRLLTTCSLLVLIFTFLGFLQIKAQRSLVTQKMFHIKVAGPGVLTRDTQNLLSVDVSDFAGNTRTLPVRVRLLDDQGDTFVVYQEKTDPQGQLKLTIENPGTLPESVLLEVSAGESTKSPIPAQTLRQRFNVVDPPKTSDNVFEEISQEPLQQTAPLLKFEQQDQKNVEIEKDQSDAFEEKTDSPSLPASPQTSPTYSLNRMYLTPGKKSPQAPLESSAAPQQTRSYSRSVPNQSAPGSVAIRSAPESQEERKDQVSSQQSRGAARRQGPTFHSLEEREHNEKERQPNGAGGMSGMSGGMGMGGGMDMGGGMGMGGGRPIAGRPGMKAGQSDAILKEHSIVPELPQLPHSQLGDSQNVDAFTGQSQSSAEYLFADHAFPSTPQSLVQNRGRKPYHNNAEVVVEKENLNPSDPLRFQVRSELPEYPLIASVSQQGIPLAQVPLRTSASAQTLVSVEIPENPVSGLMQISLFDPRTDPPLEIANNMVFRRGKQYLKIEKLKSPTDNKSTDNKSTDNKSTDTKSADDSLESSEPKKTTTNWPSAIKITDEQGMPVSAKVRFELWSGGIGLMEPAAPSPMLLDNSSAIQSTLEYLSQQPRSVSSKIFTMLTFFGTLAGIFVSLIVGILFFFKRVSGYVPLLTATATGIICILLGVAMVRDRQFSAFSSQIVKRYASYDVSNALQSPYNKVENENPDEDQEDLAEDSSQLLWEDLQTTDSRGICPVKPPLPSDSPSDSHFDSQSPLFLKVEAVGEKNRFGYELWQLR